MNKDAIIRKYETKNNKLIIFQDWNAESPRVNCDNLGTFVFYHRNYAYGDINNPTEMELADIKSDLEKPHEKLKVYMVDHSGIGFSTGSYNDPWDSSQVGFIYVTHDKIKHEFGHITDELLDKIRSSLQEEIKELNRYARGYVYGFILYELEHCPHCNNTAEIEIENGYGHITENPEEILNYACESEDEVKELLAGEVKI